MRIRRLLVELCPAEVAKVGLKTHLQDFICIPSDAHAHYLHVEEISFNIEIHHLTLEAGHLVAPIRLLDRRSAVWTGLGVVGLVTLRQEVGGHGGELPRAVALFQSGFARGVRTEVLLQQSLVLRRVDPE